MDQNQGMADDKKTERDGREPMEMLEEALVVCKFGKFQVYMTLLTMAASSVLTFVYITAFILPVAECDLKLTDIQKGLLGSMPFFGLTSTAIFVSFLTDTFGRKMFIVYGFIGQFVTGVIGGSSQNFWTLAIAKLLEGICISLCHPGFLVMFSEFLHKNVRQRLMLIRASFLPFNVILLSLIAWAILTQKWDFRIVDGYIEIHSWNIYLYICSLRGLLGLVYYYCIPESPKFLLSKGQEKKALDVLKYIYSVNTGNNKDSFPVTTLNSKGLHTSTKQISFKKQITKGLLEVKFLFKKPLFAVLLQLSIVSFCLFLTQITLTVWTPQLTTIGENYEKEHNHSDRFCVMVTEYTDSEKELRQNDSSTNFTVNEVCVTQISGPDTYMSGISLGGISIAGVIITTYLAHLIGVKMTLIISFVTSSACLSALYWATSVTVIATLLAAANAVLNLCLSLLINICVQVFPTSLRALGLSITLMMGRLAALLSGILFPILLNYGCMVPFAIFSVVLLCVSGVIFFLPFKDNSAEGVI